MEKYKRMSREEYRKGMLEASKDPEFIKRNEEIMKEFEGIDAKIGGEWQDDSQNFLYHYTKYESVKSIFKNRSLRFSDYRFLNDGSELKYSIKVATKSCEDVENKNYFFSGAIYNKTITLYDMLKQLSNNQIMTSKIITNKNETILKRTINSNTIFYIFSMSKNSNNKKMWSDYASNECCIVFKKKEIDSWFNKICYKINDDYTQYLSNNYEVYYGPTYLDFFIKFMLIYPFFDFVALYFNNSFLYRLLPFTKTGKWEKEQEYRLGFAINNNLIKKHENILKECSCNISNKYRHMIDLLDFPVNDIIYEIKTKKRKIYLALNNLVKKMHLNIKVTFVD